MESSELSDQRDQLEAKANDARLGDDDDDDEAVQSKPPLNASFSPTCRLQVVSALVQTPPEKTTDSNDADGLVKSPAHSPSPSLRAASKASSITITRITRNKSSTDSPEGINVRVSPTRQLGSNTENKLAQDTSNPTAQKRNVALKNTSPGLKDSAGAQVLRQQPNSNILHQHAKKAHKSKITDSPMNEDSYSYDSGDDYVPPNKSLELSGSSEPEPDASPFKTRPRTRSFKKQKFGDEDDTVSLKSDEPSPKTKSTARKSTTWLPQAASLAQSPTAATQPQITHVVKANGLPSSPSSHSKQAQLIVNTSSAQASKSLIATAVSQQTSASAAAAAKQFRNRLVQCKPVHHSIATQCFPMRQDASTQVSLDDIPLTRTIVPVPVPINVPMPICMYQAPMPVPILIPIPVPVPVFIPTTKRTFDRVERRIKKLRRKLPSDPYEFEILMYAEQLARQEGIAGFEESSDGESEPEQMESSSNLKRKARSHDLVKSHHHHHETIGQHQHQHQHHLNPNTLSEEGPFKWFYGVKIFNTWLTNKIEAMKMAGHTRLPDELLKLKNEELNVLLAEFVQEIRKPTGESYAPESVYYLCLGIQHYLQEKGLRTENIFLDYQLFDKFQASFNEIALRYQIRINSEGHIVSRIEEEILWESKQLGAYSPFVLLNTILYFNTKHFFLDKPESHMKLSFTNVKKHTKRNIGPNNEDFGKTVYLRYYPVFQGVEQVIYEQGENFDNPLRCPVALYNFYLSKCPENVKNRSDVFYLLPERTSLPTSPVWFSNQPLGEDMLERMLNRIKMVKEVNELLVAASPNPLTHLV